MIKARLAAGDEQVMYLGIDAENVARLRQNQPIQFDGRQFGYEGTIIIEYADDIETLKAKFVHVPKMSEQVEG